MNFVSSPIKKETVQTDVVEIVEVQPDKSKSFILVFCLFKLYNIHQRETINNSYRYTIHIEKFEKK